MRKEKIGVHIAVKKDILGILQKCLLGFCLNIIIYHLHLLSVMWNDLSVTSGKDMTIVLRKCFWKLSAWRWTIVKDV